MLSSPRKFASTVNTPALPEQTTVDRCVSELQANGVMFCVCNAAITVYSAVAAQGRGMQAADVMKDWQSGLLPGIQVVPSGVWAVGRAQEHGCAYCFAG